MSSGVEQSIAAVKVSELYSPPRVTEAARTRPDLGIKGLKAVDLTTPRPNGGSWDFTQKQHRDEAMEIIENDDPDWVIGCPPCTDFSGLGRSNHRRMDPDEVRRRMREARTHLNFCVQVYRNQLSRGKDFSS